MSRILSQTLPRFLHRHPPAASFHHQRHKSGKSGRAEFIELDIEQVSSSQISSPEDVIPLGIKRLEDAIQSIVVRRATPDWLPFLPGYSFLVPQRAREGDAHPASSPTEVVGELASSGSGRDRIFSLDLMLEEEESLAFTSSRGWPSSSFFIEGTSEMEERRMLEHRELSIIHPSGSLPIHSMQVVEVELEIQDDNDLTDATSNTGEAD